MRKVLDIQDEMADANRSAVQKYRALIVGRPGLGALLKYELITMVCSSLPGALGLWLRARLYPLLLGKCGRGVVFGHGVVLRHPHKIFIGDGVVVDDHCLLDAKGSANTGITIGSGVFIGRGSVLHCKNGDLTVGDGANLGFYCDISSSSRVTIGAKSLLAPYCFVVGGGHDFAETEVAVVDQTYTSKGIEIGEGVWMGAKATVLDGVTIGAHAIVGAHALVNTDLPAGSIAAGVPAKVLRSRAEA